MSDRFNPFPLLLDAWGAIRVRATVGHEHRDWAALVVLGLLPLGLGFWSVWSNWVIRDSSSLIAGFSLMAASLVAVIPQLASWRQRLTDKNSRVDGVGRRKLDEAVSHTLVGVVASIILAVLAVVLSNIVTPSQDGTDPRIALPWAARLITGGLVGGGAYLILTLLLVVNLLFDAYRDANGLGRGNRRLDDWAEDENAA